MSTETNSEKIIGYMAWEPRLGIPDLEIGKTYTAPEAFLDWHHADPEYDGLYITRGEPMNFSQYSPDEKSLFSDYCTYYKVLASNSDVIGEYYDGVVISVSKVKILEKVSRDEIVRRQIEIAKNSPQFHEYPYENQTIANDNKDAKLLLDGRCSKATTSGDGTTCIIGECKTQNSDRGCVKFAASGECSAVVALASCSSFALAGSHSFIEIQGDRSDVATSGVCAELSIKSVGAKVAVSGDCSELKSTGDKAILAVSGSHCNSSVEGKDSIIAILGQFCSFRGINGTPVCVADYGEDWKFRGFVTGRIGENGLKENTFYTVENGQFVEASIVDRVD